MRERVCSFKNTDCTLFGPQGDHVLNKLKLHFLYIQLDYLQLFETIKVRRTFPYDLISFIVKQVN